MICPHLKKLLLLISFQIAGFAVFSQYKIISGTVKDNESDETLPFVSVRFIKTSVGKLTDSAGHFSFTLTEWPSDTLEITSVGYKPFQFFVGDAKDTVLLNVLMQRSGYIDAVVVKTKIDRGLWLWKRIVKHKPENDRYKYDNFSYELYNKLEVDIKNLDFDKMSKNILLKPVAGIFKPVTGLIKSNIDTSEGIPYLPAYLTEVISDYYFQKKPMKRREIIKAANTNGVKNESVLKLLGGMDQNVNVYSNFIPVFDKSFVSPISDNGDNYYKYRIIDTQYVNKKRLIHFIFIPKRRGENTFEGDGWVHDTTYAVQKINMRLGKDANVNFLKTLSLIQEYKLINDSTWFLYKDKFVADLNLIGEKRPGFIGRKTTTYKNVIVDDTSVTNELDKNTILEEVITLKNAAEKQKIFWDTARHEALSKTETAIIKMIDTLTNAPVFKKFTNRLSFIGTGYANIGNYEVGPWFNWITYNGWEGLRLRFDLGTNAKFSKKVWLHGYAAYGFKDHKWKGKADIFYLPRKNPRLYLYAAYTNDLDFGQSYYGEVSSDNIFALAIRKPNIPFKFINIEEKRFEFYNQTKAGFSTLLAIVHKDFTPLKNIPDKNLFPVAKGYSPFTTFETSLRLRFAYLEKYLEGNFLRVSLGSPYPIPEIYFTKGVAGVFNSAYNYFKINGSISDYIKISPYGSISYSLFAGKTFGTLPYVLLDIAPGNELYYYNKFAFNMMNRYEFIHDNYTGINFEHNVGNGLFRFIPKLKFRQFWNVKMLWGGLSNENKALNFVNGHNFQTLDGRTYMEVGTGIDNILRVLRLDFVWRVLPQPLPANRSSRFGIFGSFRVSF